MLLFVGAERCVHCRKLWHILAQEAVIPLTDGLDTRYLDADLNPALATRLGVRGLPALLALRGGHEISRAPAHLTSENVQGWLKDLFA
ncbi:thioredoxin-like negative regulator of GroEL [Enterobacter sp. A4]